MRRGFSSEPQRGRLVRLLLLSFVRSRTRSLPLERELALPEHREITTTLTSLTTGWGVISEHGLHKKVLAAA